jgi:hypothetical protein
MLRIHQDSHTHPQHLSNSSCGSPQVHKWPLRSPHKLCHSYGSQIMRTGGMELSSCLTPQACWSRGRHHGLCPYYKSHRPYTFLGSLNTEIPILIALLAWSVEASPPFSCTTEGDGTQSRRPRTICTENSNTGHRCAEPCMESRSYR